MPKSWGGPGRGGGAHPKDPAAALEKALATLERRLALCRRLNVGTFQEREALFRRIDALQQDAEFYLVEAPDYPADDDAA